MIPETALLVADGDIKKLVDVYANTDRVTKLQSIVRLSYDEIVEFRLPLVCLCRQAETLKCGGF